MLSFPGHLLVAIGWPGPFELLIIGVIFLLLFGSRLPSAMRSLGRGVVEFKKGISGVDDEPKDEASADSKP
jgi:sec-independent protein translocase protein TatA